MSQLVKLSNEKDPATPHTTEKNEFITHPMTVAQLAIFLQWIQLHTPYMKQKHFHKNIARPEDPQSIKDLYSRTSGEDWHQCQFSGNGKVHTRNGLVPATNCHASIAIHFSLGYKPKSKDLNVRDHGQLPVLVAWQFKHNHPMTSMANLDETDLPESIKKLLYIAIAKQKDENKPDEKDFVNSYHWSDGMPTQFFNTRNLVVRQIQRDLPLFRAPKNESAHDRLQKWAKEKSSHRIAGYKDDFEIEALSDAGQDSTTTKPGKLWSFFHMSKWASDLLKNKATKIYVDCLKLEKCHVGEIEDTYLYTIWDDKTRSHPAAFMVANNQQRHVIAHFFHRFKIFADFTPQEVLYDCDSVIHCAAKDVWSDVQTTPFYWPIFKAFHSLELPVKNLLDVPETPLETAKQSDADFHSVVEKSLSQETGEREMRSFLDKYMKYPLAIVSLKRRWDVCLLDEFGFGEEDLKVKFKWIESWHSLILRSISEVQDRRPDCLIYKMVHVMEPEARARQIASEKGAFQKNTEEEKKHDLSISRWSGFSVLKRVMVEKEGHFLIRSPFNESQTFSVRIFDSDSNQATCTCDSWLENQVWCEHIFIALKWKTVSAKMLLEAQKSHQRIENSLASDHVTGNATLPQGQIPGHAVAAPQIQQNYAPMATPIFGPPSNSSGPVPYNGPPLPAGTNYVMPQNYMGPNIPGAAYSGMPANYAVPPNYQSQPYPVGNFNPPVNPLAPAPLYQGQGQNQPFNPHAANVPLNQTPGNVAIPQNFVGPNGRISPKYAARSNPVTNSNTANKQGASRIPMKPLDPITPNNKATNGANRAVSAPSKTPVSNVILVDESSPQKTAAEQSSGGYKDGDVMFIDDSGEPVMWRDFFNPENIGSGDSEMISAKEWETREETKMEFYRWMTRMSVKFRNADLHAKTHMMKELQAAGEEIRNMRENKRRKLNGRSPF